MKIAYVSSEVMPFAKTGGLADVAGALPKELYNLGNDVKVFMPKYYQINEHDYNHQYDSLIGEVKVSTGGYEHLVHVFYGKLPNSNVDIYFIHYPNFFHRKSLYTNDWDEDDRFILFSKSVIHIMQKLGWGPDIINVNDWQAALIPVLLKERYSWDRLFHHTKTVLTIHNIGYQGRFEIDSYKKAELPSELYENHGILVHEGDSNFLKAGILYADTINTVSDTYAKELLTPEYGAGMDGYLWTRHTDFFGILNGVDYSIWNPETDKYLPHNYSVNNMAGKLKNKKFLLEKLGLKFKSEVPVIGIVSRLAIQKGFDIIGSVLKDLLQLNLQFVVLGSGEELYENMLQKAAIQNPDKIAVYFGYSEEIAHLIEAGSDIFLMPSRYEPCGLNQIYSLKYGTVPVVRKTGGLADTVQDWNEYNQFGQDIGNGFSFYEYSGDALLRSVERAINDFQNKHVWRKIQQNGMEKDYSWKHSAEEYVKLYQKTINKI
jgi:starch synthase